MGCNEYFNLEDLPKFYRLPAANYAGCPRRTMPVSGMHQPFAIQSDGKTFLRLKRGNTFDPYLIGAACQNDAAKLQACWNRGCKSGTECIRSV